MTRRLASEIWPIIGPDKEDIPAAGFANRFTDYGRDPDTYSLMVGHT